MSSNNNNFSLNTDQDTITIPAKSQTKVNVIFNPSSIGSGTEQQPHQSIISFNNDKVGTLTYNVKGVGTKPQKLQTPVIIKTEIGVSATTNISFQNPSNHTIRCDLSLSTGTSNSFRVVLDKLENITLGPRERIPIPIAFCPEMLARHEAQLRIIGRLSPGKTWSPDNADASELSWTYPLQGVAFNWISQRRETDNELKIIECVCGERIEEQLEFELNQDLFRFDERYLINMKKNAMAIEDYSIVNENSPNQTFIQNSVGIQLLKRDNEKTNIVRFNIVYSPTKLITMDCVLVLTLGSGGQLKYPIRFVTRDAPPDDEIVIEAVGLNRASTIGFRLYSPTDSPIPFDAYLTSNSDRSFSITPEHGDLLPASANGTLLKLSFCPTVYGRTFNGMLIIDAKDNQWKYVIRGSLPQYEAPKTHSSLPSVNSDDYASRRGNKKRNFILENLQLHQTAISSPIKGASVLTKPNETTSV